MTTDITEISENDTGTEDSEHTSPSEDTATSDDVESEADAPEDHEETDDAPKSRWRRLAPHTLAIVIGLTMALALGGLVGWLGYRVHQSEQAAHEQAEFVQAARQGAVNLTTIDWQQAEADVRRVLDSATGTFYDDFSQRSKPFIDVVKQVQSKSEGTVTMAGLESVDGDQARVLVAMSVRTTNAGTQEQTPRAWRMRIDVQKVGDDMKVSNVEFVP